MTDKPTVTPLTEPRTEAGRRLIAALPTEEGVLASPRFVRELARRILAIEAEARDAARTDSLDLRAALDAAYADRNLVVQAFGQAMEDAGWPVAWGVDESEPDWPVLYIETPEGQVSWHVPKAERIYEPARVESWGPITWDGHTDEAKFARLRAALATETPGEPT